MIFSINKKTPIVKEFKPITKPNIGDVRYTNKFAWLPIRIYYKTEESNYSKSKKQYIWLEKYLFEEKYTRSLKREYNDMVWFVPEWVESYDWKHIDNLPIL